MRHEWEKIKDFFGKLNYILSRSQKQLGIVVAICTLLAACFEMVGISAIMPLIESFTNVEQLHEKWYLQPIVSIFHIEDQRILVYCVCVGIIVIYLFKNLFFIFHTWVVKKYTYKIKRELGTRVMESYMAQGYIFFVDNNTSRLLQGISGDVAAVNSILSNLFNLMTKLLTIVVIGIFILLREPVIAFILLFSAALCVSCIQLFFRKPMYKYGMRQREAGWSYNQVCLEMMHGSKEVLVTGRQGYFKRKYINSIEQQNKYTIKIEMATTVPAYIIEMVCVAGLIFAVMGQIGRNGVSAEMVTSLGVIAVAAFRILPSVGVVTSSLNAIRSNIPSFNFAYQTIQKVNELERALEEKANNEMTEQQAIKREKGKELTISHVYYRYPNMDHYVLNDINLTISPQRFIGIIGASGAGKSTFVDVLLGLLKPERGQILFDGTDISLLGQEWNKRIGYVPQSIYLVDDDIRSNIAFGIEADQIDDEQVWRALELAQLASFVREQPKGLDSRVGERGVKFSGGQRQRVAIARALYHNPEILVLDEATAALDNETEKALMESIDAFQGEKTLIVVAHRLTTIRNCDYIYEVSDGGIIERRKEEVFEQ